VVIVDVGCGDGRWVLSEAAAHPEREYVGIELLEPLVTKAAAKAPSNAQFVPGDAVAWLRRRAAGSIDEVHVYHPQPYYDPAEVAFGVGTSGFFESAWRALKPGGRLVLQTDNRRYGKYLLEAARRHFETEVQPGAWPDAPKGRTRREQIALGKKLTILRVLAKRREEPLEADPPPPYFDLSRPGLRRRRS
jgi:tRNA (guanine-N7-)-methyltransferase